MIKRNFILTSLLIIAISGCARRSSLTPESLKNETYSLDSFDGMKVVLKDGRFEANKDSELEMSVELLDQIAMGRIQNSDAAAVVLVSNSGGTAAFVDLALVLEKNGNARNVATLNLGDRVKVNHLTIEDDSILVQMTVHGPDDPICCPTLDVQRSFVFRDSVLVETSATMNNGPEDRD